jgi:hypothetical protein
MHIASKTFAFGCLLLAAAACGGGSSGAGTGATGTGATGTGATGTGATGTGATGTGGSGHGGSGTGGSGTTGTSAAQACADSVHAQCTQRDKCSVNSFLNNRAYGSETECEMRLTPPCLSGLMATGTVQTPAKIEDCVAAYPAYACVDFFDGNPPAACAPTPGTLAVGAACGTSAQCASTFCSIAPNQVCGTCAALPMAGATCQTTADCGRDLSCAIPSGMTTGTCTSYVMSGGACLTGTAPCAVGFACVGEVVASKTMGTCKPQGSTAGIACDATRKTAPNCDFNFGMLCIPTSATSAGVGTCQPVTVVDAGMTCGNIGANPVTGYADCHSGATCIKATTSAVTGTCTTPAADGMPCDSDITKGPACLVPAKCLAPTGSTGTAGTCTVPDATKCM